MEGLALCSQVSWNFNAGISMPPSHHSAPHLCQHREAPGPSYFHVMCKKIEIIVVPESPAGM